MAVTAQRVLRDLTRHYRVDDGRRHSAPTRAWRGGERYGDTHDRYYAELRGVVRGARPGDEVEAWFTTGKRREGVVRSEAFTYRVADDIGGDVLVLAAEDVTGISPAQGVTDHYDVVIWETGDDVVPRAVGQLAGTADVLALQLELSVRDYLNEGGKALVTGQYNQFAQGSNGGYWYNPFAPPECTTPEAYPCLPLLNDFQQYWLGAHTYVDDGGTGADGQPFPVTGVEGGFAGFTGTLNGGDSADNQTHTVSLVSTSSILPPEQFPQFASTAAADCQRPGAAPYDPYSGEWAMFSQWADQGWKRLTRTVDLTGSTTGTLRFRTSYDVEPGWDFLVVEAHEVGTDTWTTLPDVNGHTTQETGDSCASGWTEIHPFVARYQGADCSPTGTTGAWHAATGNNAGWQEWQVDLTPYAGRQVEVSISYLTDWGTQGLGVLVDDAVVLADGSPAVSTSFESGLDGWATPARPEGSTPANTWARSQEAFDEGAATMTDDTVFTGFGIEGLTTRDMRHDFVARAMEHLLE